VLRGFLRRPMNGYNFTEDVRAALACAREESARLRHEYVGTEHILLGILRRQNVAVAVIESFGVKPEALVDAVESGVKKGSSHPTGPDLPYTSRAKKVLEFAMVEARELNHNYVGTEHMLLGLVREEKGIAGQVLIHSGITLDRAREQTLRILGAPASDRPRIVATARSGAGLAALAWPDREGAPGSGSTTMAASMIELMARDSGINAVFLSQGIDVAKLVEALRAFMPPAPAPPTDAPPAA
jgi:ATP-dependent Clp protease ATP-binding subunit ClpA